MTRLTVETCNSQPQLTTVACVALPPFHSCSGCVPGSLLITVQDLMEPFPLPLLLFARAAKRPRHAQCRQPDSCMRLQAHLMHACC